MAINNIQGTLVGLWVSTVLSNPAPTDFKEVVCATDTGLDGTKDVNSTSTKCGVIKSYGQPGWTINGSGVANHTPAGTEVSADEMAAIFQGDAEVLVRVAHRTTAGLYYRQGQGGLTSYSESANEGDNVTFDFTFDITGDLTLVAPV